jgi:hypothetical protein
MAERRFPTPEYGKHHKTQLDTADLRIVSSDEKVFDFPKAEITSAEKVRRAMAEAQRLASLAPGEWRLWIDRAAERLGVPRATLEGLISAIIKDSERRAREDKGEARRQEERVRRQQRERKREQHALLKDFEIRPVVVHPTKRADVSRHGYRAAQFEDAFARFLPPEPNIRTL